MDPTSCPKTHFFLGGEGQHTAVLWAYCWFCTQELYLAVFSGPSGTLCKARALPTVLLFWPARIKGMNLFDGHQI